MMRTSLSGATICTTVKTEGRSCPLKMEQRLRFVNKIAIGVKYSRSTLKGHSLSREHYHPRDTSRSPNEKDVPVTVVSLVSLKGHNYARDTFCFPRVPSEWRFLSICCHQ